MRVKSVETHLCTCDSRIAATFARKCRFGVRNRNIVMAAIQYVGHLDKLLKLNYGVLNQTVLLGTWGKANYMGAIATIKKDRWVSVQQTLHRW